MVALMESRKMTHAPAHYSDFAQMLIGGRWRRGEKNSGIGRFSGRWAVDAFTTNHWITIQHQPREYPVNARQLSGPWGGG
ncbi:MAG: Aldehyde dehydrogenase [Verrucomicrobiales bacterium]|nr:Aldehyde dehydrogenase [Verrucomicrobiales bacterium]